jgi:rubrerythrin
MADFTVVALFGLAGAIMWIVIGWRAMKAHEKIADSLEEMLRASRPPSVSLFTKFPNSEVCPRCGYTIPAGVAKCPNCAAPRPAQ